MKERIGKMRRLVAAGATTLALAGCTDAAPSTRSPQQTLDLLCATTPSDTRSFPPYSLDLYRCTDLTANLPTRRVLLSRDGTPLVSFFPTSPKGENDRYSEGQLLGNTDTGECLIVEFDTQGYKFTNAEIYPCPPSSATSGGIHV